MGGYVHTNTGAYRGERAQLESQGMWVQGTEFGSSGRASVLH